MAKKGLILLLAACVVFLSAGFAMANSSVAWISPPNGTTLPTNTLVKPTGQASGSGTVGGTGLDLMMVIDVSGSMSGAGLDNAKAAANALIDALPTSTTQVGLVSFHSYANLVKQLSPLAVPANVTAIHNEVNGLSAGGGTFIGAGITTATAELQSSRAVAAHSKMQVVLSDGYSGGTPANDAAAAWAAGITVHSVGVPGHDPTTMANIAAQGHGVYTNVTDLNNLKNIFNGTGGNLVALDHVEIRLPDGTVINAIATDGLGNFILPDWKMLPGENVFRATAFGTDGSSATAELRLIGMGAGAVGQTPGTYFLLLNEGKDPYR
jgi:Ca-activated chloride channel homolog